MGEWLELEMAGEEDALLSWAEGVAAVVGLNWEFAVAGVEGPVVFMGGG
jgi:hypothetical protein